MTSREGDPPPELRWWRFRHPLDHIRDIAGVPIGVWTVWTLINSSAPLALNVIFLLAVLATVATVALEFGARALERHRAGDIGPPN
jgi:hypothetical protein